MDLRLDYDVELQSADLAVTAGRPLIDDGLRTAIIISLFSDARAEATDPLPTADGDRRGWWADSFPAIDGDKIGSRLWLLSREKETSQTLERARRYAREALTWLIDDGIAAALDVAASWHASGVMRLDVDLSPSTSDASAKRYTLFWTASYAV